MVRPVKSTLFILASFLLFAASAVSAQSIPGIKQPVFFEVSPQFPRPGSTVTVAAQSYSTNLNQANFTWTVNGKVYKKGPGITSINVPAGKAGAETTVSVSVDTPDLGTFENDTSWKPADVALLWKSDGYVPPFYKGKALLAYGGSFTVVAVPELFSNGKRVDPRTLVYTWSKNGTVDASQSGYGKNMFTDVQSSYTRGGDDVTVEVSDATHGTGATKTITLSPALPEILFYADSPLYGIELENSLASFFALGAEEITLRMVPYNVSDAKTAAALSINWNINGQTVPAFTDKNEIVLRKSGTGGQSAVGVSIQHKEKVLQGGSADITIQQ